MVPPGAQVRHGAVAGSGPVIDEPEGAQIGIIAYGTTRPAIDEARDQLTADGLVTSYMAAAPADQR